MTNYFQEEATTLLNLIVEERITRDDIAIALQCLYNAGVLDAALYTDEEKQKMLTTVKKLYNLKST